MLKLSCKTCLAIYDIDVIDNIAQSKYTPQRIGELIDKIKSFFCPLCGGKAREVKD